MLVKARTALLLTANDDTIRSIMSVATDLDVDLEVHQGSLPGSSYDVVFASKAELKHVTEIREKVVVLEPGDKVQKYLEAGYERFVFSLELKHEILSAFYVRSIDEIKSEAVESGPFYMDFVNHVFKIDGVDSYVTKAEERALKRKFLGDGIDKSNSSDRAYLCRLRKRFPTLRGVI